MSSKKGSKKKLPDIDITYQLVGRPTSYRPEYCQMLIDHQSRGGSYQGFAGKVDVCIQTLYEWESKYDDFLDAKKRAKAKHREWMDERAIEMINGTSRGNVAAWFIIMKNMHGLQNDPLPDAEDIKKVAIGFDNSEE